MLGRTLSDHEQSCHDHRRRGDRPRLPRSRTPLDEDRRREKRQRDRRRGEQRAEHIERVMVQLGGIVGRDASPDSNDGEERDWRIDQQQHLPGRNGQHEAAEHGAERESHETDGRDEGDGSDSQALLLEQTECESHRARSGHRRRDAHQHPDDDQLFGGRHDRSRHARRAEQHEADEHHPTSAETVCERAECQHQAAEDHRIAAGHPLQSDRRCLQFPPDRGQCEVEDRVVEHLDEEDGGQARQGHP